MFRIRTNYGNISEIDGEVKIVIRCYGNREYIPGDARGGLFSVIFFGEGYYVRLRGDVCYRFCKETRIVVRSIQVDSTVEFAVFLSDYRLPIPLVPEMYNNDSRYR